MTVGGDSQVACTICGAFEPAMTACYPWPDTAICQPCNAILDAVRRRAGMPSWVNGRAPYSWSPLA